MKRFLLMMVVFGVFVMLTACMSVAESSEPKAVDGTLVALPSGEMVPDFVLNPPQNSEAYFGVGYAKQSALNLSIRLAETRARADIANQVKTSIQEVVQYYARDTGVNNPEALIEYTEIITREVTETTMVGLVIVNRIPMEDGGVWILAKLGMDKVKESLELSMKTANESMVAQKAAAMAEWKAQEAFKYLDDIMASGNIVSLPVTQ